MHNWRMTDLKVYTVHVAIDNRLAGPRNYVPARSEPYKDR